MEARPDTTKILMSDTLRGMIDESDLEDQAAQVVGQPARVVLTLRSIKFPVDEESNETNMTIAGLARSLELGIQTITVAVRVDCRDAWAAVRTWNARRLTCERIEVEPPDSDDAIVIGDRRTIDLISVHDVDDVNMTCTLSMSLTR